jgi:hypothetical protein
MMQELGSWCNFVDGAAVLCCWCVRFCLPCQIKIKHPSQNGKCCRQPPRQSIVQAVPPSALNSQSSLSKAPTPPSRAGLILSSQSFVTCSAFLSVLYGGNTAASVVYDAHSRNSSVLVLCQIKSHWSPPLTLHHHLQASASWGDSWWWRHWRV